MTGAVDAARHLRAIAQELYEESGDCRQFAPRYPLKMAEFLAQKADQLEALVREREGRAGVEPTPNELIEAYQRGVAAGEGTPPAENIHAGLGALADELGYSDEYYLAMAALDRYPVVDDLPKSTSVVFRIHQLGHEIEKLRAGASVPASPPHISDEPQFRAFVGCEKELMLKKLDEFHALDVEGRRPYFARLQAFAEVQQWLDRADRTAAALAGVPSPQPEKEKS